MTGWRWRRGNSRSSTYEGVREVGEQRVVVVAGDGVARAASDGEGEGLRLGLGVGGEDDVVRARPEMSLHERGVLGRRSLARARSLHYVRNFDL